MTSGQKKVAGMRSVKHSRASSTLELKLDELRKELSSVHGGIFPHSVLSTQQISLISTQKPNSMELVSFVSTTLPFKIHTKSFSLITLTFQLVSGFSFSLATS